MIKFGLRIGEQMHFKVHEFQVLFDFSASSIISFLANITMLRLRNRISFQSLGSIRGNSTTKFQDSRRLLEKPEYIRSSWLKTVVNGVAPMTMSIINTKNIASVENLAASVSFCVPEPIYYEGPDDKIGKRRFDDSWIELTLPFSGDENLRNTLVKLDKRSLRYGKLFEILDGLAADVCYRHVGTDEGWGGMPIVTASVDRMKIVSEISLMNDIKLQAYLTYVGRSSLEVTIDIISIKDSGEPVLVGNTQFIMVAR